MTQPRSWLMNCILASKEGPCWQCGEPTRFVEVNFEAYVCSAACDEAGWAEFYRAAVPEPQPEPLRIYFNPFNFTVEENNEMLRKGWEPIPMRIPDKEDS